MTTELKYGKMNKKIVFTDNDHRHAQLVLRLKHDDLRQSEFFRACVTGYLEQDERILNFIDDIKTQSVKKKTKSNRLRTEGKQRAAEAGFSDDQLEDLFDLIAEEHPDL